MRTLPILLSAPFVVSATPPAIVSLPAYGEAARAWTSVGDAPARTCRDRIERARANAGQPPRDRAPASADKRILHYAVDRRIDGCGVLVPVGAPAEILPMPEPGRPVVIPAKPRQ